MGCKSKRRCSSLSLLMVGMPPLSKRRMLMKKTKKNKKKKKTKEEVVEKVDRISDLPDFLLHGILSFLSAKEAAQTAVLSKTWRQACLTNPNLLFDTRLPKTRGPDYLTLIDKTLQRYRQQRLRIQNFKLHMHHADEKLESFVHSWVETALLGRVEKLDLLVRCLLPQTIFASKSLVELHLGFCSSSVPNPWGLDKLKDKHVEYRFSVPNATNLSSINLVSLKKLYIYDVWLDDPTLNTLISGCPLIEEFSSRDCRGFKQLLLSGCSKIKRLSLRRARDLEFIDLDGRSLESFTCHGRGYTDIEVFGKDAFKNLRSLEFSSVVFTGHSFYQLISKSRFLRYLRLYRCTFPKRMDIKSRSIKLLMLCKSRIMREATIDAPNLEIFQFEACSSRHKLKKLDISSNWFEPIALNDCENISIFDFYAPGLFFFTVEHNAVHFLSSLSLVCQPKASLRLYIKESILGTLFFYQLGQLIQKSNGFDTLRLIVNCSNFEFDVQKLKHFHLPPPCQIEHLNLRITPVTSRSQSDLLNGLFWCCHPKILHVRNDNADDGFTSLVCRMLASDRRESNSSDDDSSLIKCWRMNHLPVFEDSMPLSLRHSSNASRFKGEMVTFKLKW